MPVIVRDAIQNLQIEDIPNWEKLSSVTFRVSSKIALSSYEIVLSLVNQSDIHALNLQFRQKDKATDVLSFNFSDTIFNPEQILGDIIISTEIAQQQAIEHSYDIKKELAFLFVHGLLHLLGYDHQNDAEAVIMFDLQRQILTEYTHESL